MDKLIEALEALAAGYEAGKCMYDSDMICHAEIVSGEAERLLAALRASSAE